MNTLSIEANSLQCHITCDRVFLSYFIDNTPLDGLIMEMFSYIGVTLNAEQILALSTQFISVYVTIL